MPSKLDFSLIPFRGSAEFSRFVKQIDVLIIWTDMPHRVITVDDILGRLLKGIGKVQHAAKSKW
jgi:hypothetical protein